MCIRDSYYGGIRKYQWGTMPLAIHGVFTRADGSSVSFAVGEDENDPVFCITDLLPQDVYKRQGNSIRTGCWSPGRRDLQRAVLRPVRSCCAAR